MFALSVFDWKYSFWVDLGQGSGLSVIAQCGRSLNPIFQEFFTRINKVFVLAGGLHTGLSFYGV